MAYSHIALKIRQEMRALTAKSRKGDGKLCITTVRTPVALKVDCMLHHKSVDVEIGLIWSKLENMKRECMYLYAIAYLQFTSGCRVSEILAITASCISDNHTIYIKGLKGSYSRFINAGVVGEFMLKLRKRDGYVFSHYNRFSVYRAYKRYNILYVLVNKQRNAVTHAMRHLFIKQAVLLSSSLHDVKQLVGHKELKSTEHYANS